MRRKKEAEWANLVCEDNLLRFSKRAFEKKKRRENENKRKTNNEAKMRKKKTKNNNNVCMYCNVYVYICVNVL